MGIANAIGAIIMFIVDGIIAIFDIVRCHGKRTKKTREGSKMISS